MRRKATGVIAATLLLGAGVFSGVAGADPTPTPTPTPSTTSAAPSSSAAPTSPAGPAPGPSTSATDSATAAPAGPKTSVDKDGTYAVGTDIVPGTYSSAGPVGDGTCYWKRMNGTGTVANALTKKSSVVVIEATDTSFKTDGCQPWQLTPDAAPPTTMAPAIAGLQLGAMLAGIPHP